VPVAERSGFISVLGDWVLRRACHDARAWPGLTLAVNISAVQINRPGFVDRVEEVLAESGVEARRIELEITESIVLDNDDLVRNIIDQLRCRGVSFALDDFGTGYSSLTTLQKFPFEKIKIDRSFVANVGLARDATIVHAVVSIGRALGMKVVAEGIETPEQARFVAAAGVYAMQGFLYGMPMRNEKLAEFLSGFEARARTSAAG
jgi:EAL domain-containing protein (putative c-di-GMP-specific phosphodiesterase class I)